MRGRLERLWNGDPARPAEWVAFDLALTGSSLVVDVDAPFHGDPAPPGPAGPTARLWEHEVVEVFVLGTGNRYLEVELGPYGHHLVLQLAGVRRIVAQERPIGFEVDRRGTRWTGRALVPRDDLPPPPWRVNVYAIHGVGEERRHLALHPVPGDRPDFHRLEAFRPWPGLVSA